MTKKPIVLCLLLLGLFPLAAPAQVVAGDEIELSPLGGFERVASMNARGEVLVAWAIDRIQGRLIAPDDTPLGPEFQISEPTSEYFENLSASIDLRGFSVVWNQFSRSDSSSWLRRFDSTGDPVTGQIDVGRLPTVETDPRGKSMVVRLNNGGLEGQRYNVAGVPIGPPVRLAEARVAAPIQVAVDAQGGFVVVWKTDKAELFGRRFDADAKPRGPVFQIAARVGAFDLAGNGKGSFVVLWTLLRGESFGIYAQAYSPSGAAVHAPVLVAPRVTQSLKISVGMDADGRFLATWDTSRSRTNGPLKVFGRFFTASGSPFAGPFQVGQRVRSQDFAADTAGGPAGEFFVTWARRDTSDGLVRLMGQRLRWPD